MHSRSLLAAYHVTFLEDTEVVEVLQKDRSLQMPCLLQLNQEDSINRLHLTKVPAVDTDHKAHFVAIVSDFYPPDY